MLNHVHLLLESGKTPLGKFMQRLQRRQGAGHRIENRHRKLRTPSRGWKDSQHRTMVAYVLVRRGGYAVKAVAQYFARNATTISSTSSRYDGKVEKQPELRRQLEKVTQLVGL
jgi:hypothetical protein